MLHNGTKNEKCPVISSKDLWMENLKKKSAHDIADLLLKVIRHQVSI